MTELAAHRCAFNTPLIDESCGCVFALPLTRRDGPDIGCADAAASQRCAQVFSQLQAAALPAFGADGDPLTTPHSVTVKIQHGGLMGLQRLRGGEPRVENIDELLGRITEIYGETGIPVAQVVEDITSYRLRRRRRPRGAIIDPAARRTTS